MWLIIIYFSLNLILFLIIESYLKSQIESETISKEDLTKFESILYNNSTYIKVFLFIFVLWIPLILYSILFKKN